MRSTREVLEYLARPVIERSGDPLAFPGEHHPAIFGIANPIGKHFTIDRDWKGFGDDMPFEIVGVVGDANTMRFVKACTALSTSTHFKMGMCLRVRASD